MTISLVPVDERVRRFTAAGGETTFPVTFPFFAAADLLVQRVRAGVTTTLTLGTDYSVSGAGNQAGGQVVLAAAAMAGDLVVIVSLQPVARTSDWQDGAALTARALNAEFARWWIAAQQLARDVARGVKVPVTDAVTVELPPAALRAGKFLAFDLAGQPVMSDGASAGGVAFSTFSQTLLSLGGAVQWRAALDVMSSADTIAACAAAASTAIARDGSRPPTANISFANKRITELAAAQAASDAVTLQQLQAGYRLTGITRYVGAGAGTYVPPADTRALLVKAIGGGGGGGGGATYGGGGGASGGYGEVWISPVASSYTYSVGAGGAGGAPGGNGGDGGATTISSLVCNGGGGGLAGTSSNNLGGQGGSVSGGNFGARGSGGGKGECASMGVVHLNGGPGGSGYWGGGGGGSNMTAYVGEPGSRGGGGAGGAQAGGGTAGGNGGSGVIEIWEFV